LLVSRQNFVKLYLARLLEGKDFLATVWDRKLEILWKFHPDNLAIHISMNQHIPFAHARLVYHQWAEHQCKAWNPPPRVSCPRPRYIYW
jgi:hypothetical protein